MSSNWRDEHAYRVYRMTKRAERAQKIGIGLTVGCGGALILGLATIALLIAVIF